MKTLLVLFLALAMSSASAAQTLTYTIVKPTGYADGTPFGTEQLVYVVYNAADNTQLFSTRTTTGTTTAIPDLTTCVYVRAGIFDTAANSVISITLSDPSPSNCKPAPTKKVGTASISIKWP